MVFKVILTLVCMNKRIWQQIQKYCYNNSLKFNVNV